MLRETYRRRLEYLNGEVMISQVYFFELSNAFISDNSSFGRTRNRGIRTLLAFGPFLIRNFVITVL